MISYFDVLMLMFSSTSFEVYLILLSSMSSLLIELYLDDFVE